MKIDEKLEKICKDFSKLSEEQQDYILGIMQALVFAKSTNEHPSSDMNQDHDESKSVLK